ncbi:hypothetical protein EDD18DRAFT_1356841 [Armillaria luteobubalina]|uniref:Uncharacterized protein n=1 Tax=Armillaria luteobubalina TaxID=153913 RepID=A0AA39Q129_9AGAR|nr:hypothetical protein EDD18DRAFT_1356841 [Armillaria luteobubalina]
MAEVTDDSFVFANSLMGLQYFCLSMERFQFVYGWLTQWTKTLVYALQVRGEIPKTVAMPLITNKPGVNPWKITYHPVPVHINQMEMLCTQVNNSARRFQELRDFINDFTIPKFSIRLPITLLRKIAMQNLASWARALLSLQPVTMCRAEQLDHMIAAKVHDLLGFPFQPLTDILMLPIAAMGFKFPSITRINLGIAIDGVARDLNHHIPAYKAMAHITLADWTCMINGCINPFDSPGSQHEFSHYYRCLPTAWIIAQKAMMKMLSPLFLHHMDQSHVSRCQMSLTHAAKICAAKDDCIRSCKANKGAWNAWNHMHEVLNNAQISWFYTGDANLLLDRKTQCSKAKDLIHLLGHISQLPALRTTRSTSDDETTYWGSDGSMIPATAGMLDVKTITAAISGPISLAVLVTGKNNSILHGHPEIIFRPSQLGGNKAKLRHIPACSYYQWIVDIQTLSPHISLEYTPGHSCQRTTPATLNDEADHFASWAQKHHNQLPVAPIPTFFMDEFTFWTPNDGSIESEIKSFVNSSMVKAKVQELAIRRHQQMASWLYDQRSPPTFLYTHMVSAYSAAVQLYARSGQLATASGLYQKKMLAQEYCHLRCRAIESPHHIFMECLVF